MEHSKKNGLFPSEQTSRLETEFQIQYRTAVYLRLCTLLKNKDYATEVIKPSFLLHKFQVWQSYVIIIFT
jgi:hypothetical protein